MNRRDMLKLSSFAFAAASAPVVAESSNPVDAAPSIKRWDFIELTFRGPSTGNPFADVQLSATFRSGEHARSVSGFYDGDGNYKIRYMPAQTGEWHWKTASNVPALDSKTGRFLCVVPEPGNHGPIKPHNTFHFSHADGTPYFLLGTTLYNWLNRNEKLQQETLDTLGKGPFTKIRCGLFPKWYRFNHVEPALYPYVETTHLEFDLDRFYPRFFRAVENRLIDLRRLGIVADIILFHPYDHLGFSTMDAEHDDAYIRYVCARFSAFRNVWWTMANEYDLFDPARIHGQRRKDWDHLFQVLEKNDPYQHPRGIHNLADWYDHGKPWITHAIIQDGTGHPGRRLPGARARYSKPLVVDEYGYEGNNAQSWGDLAAREEVDHHWEITMQGGYGSHGETYVHPGGILWWAAGGTLVGESPARLGFLKRIMTESPFQEIEPDPGVAQGATVLALKGRYYLVQVRHDDHNQHVAISLEENACYQVDLIDTWLMRVYSLGCTQGGLQVFDRLITPSLLRFQRVEDAAAIQSAEPVQTLLAKFLKDSTIADPPKALPIRHPQEMYSVKYTIGELMDDPRTRVLFDKYLPALSTQGNVRATTIERLMLRIEPKDLSNVYALASELVKIPVAS